MARVDLRDYRLVVITVIALLVTRALLGDVIAGFADGLVAGFTDGV